MKDLPRNPGDPQESTSKNEASPGRRRLLRAGLTATPVAMTITSRSVLAQIPKQCTAPSAFVSLNASHPGADQCQGHTPAYWATHTSEWPAPYTPGLGHPANALKFCDVVQTSPCGYTPGQGFLAILQTTTTAATNSNDYVARYIGASIFNVLAGLVPQTVLTRAKLNDIWLEYLNTGGGTAGTYSPITGAHWNNAEIVEYLQTTMSA